MSARSQGRPGGASRPTVVDIVITSDLGRMPLDNRTLEICQGDRVA
jgi:hypothetical protein